MNFEERPYLEVEVVEVKTKKKKEIPEKGNWVNGENLSRIKFPCACSYKDRYERRCYGILTRDYVSDEGEFVLHKVCNGQCLLNSAEARSYDLEELITMCNIHIEKAKIVIFKEVKE